MLIGKGEERIRMIGGMEKIYVEWMKMNKKKIMVEKEEEEMKGEMKMEINRYGKKNGREWGWEEI